MSKNEFNGCKDHPPHTRGTATASQVAAWMKGITPAYTGNSMRSATGLATIKDHPRIRGEQYSLI
nr:hypothetical protein [Lactiplantibacillus pentosus]